MLYGALFLQRLVGHSGEGRTGQGADDEDPEAGDGRGVAGEERHQRRAEAAGRVDGGAGQADAEDVYAGQRQADDEAAEGAVLGLLRGHAEDAEHEDEGQHDLDQQAREGAAVHAAEAVGAEAAGHVGHAAELEDQGQQGGADQRAEALGEHIADEVLALHAAGEQHAEGDRGVDVAAGDVADAVGRGDDRQAEGQRREDVAAARRRIAADEHRGAAAEHDQCAGSDEFSQIFFHGLPSCF